MKNSASREIMSRYKVLVDDNAHYMDESERYEYGVYPTTEEAIAACRRIVDASLRESFKPGITAGELYEIYDMFGENPFIVAVNQDDKPVAFSAREYAEERVLVLTSHGGDSKQK